MRRSLMGWSAAVTMNTGGIPWRPTRSALINLRGEVVVRKKFSRTQLLRFTAKQRVELIGMEACGGAHFLGRALREQGHEVRLISGAICEAVRKDEQE